MPQVTCVPTIYSIPVNTTDPEKFEALRVHTRIYVIIQDVREGRKEGTSPSEGRLDIQLSSRGNVELFLEVFTDLY